jgi:uncharacterized protein
MKRIFISFAVAALVLASYHTGIFFGSRTIYVYDETVFQSSGPVVFRPYSNLSNIPNASSASIVVPAVDSSGKGVATNLTVQAIPGYGKALVNIDRMLFWVDTQSSIRTARSVAEQTLGINTSEYDLVFTIEANATVIEGPSAGAALTAATIAALSNRTVNNTVMMTGTINPDGTIGPVGEILAKAGAAKDIGAEAFLVPVSQSVVTTYEQVRHCEKVGWTEVCTTETVPKKVNVAIETGIKTIEVANIREAISYVFI